jgi:hypothetical protein
MSFRLASGVLNLTDIKPDELDFSNKKSKKIILTLCPCITKAGF